MSNEPFIYLEPYVYTSIDDDFALFYNTLSGQSLLLQPKESMVKDFLNKLITSPRRSIQLYLDSKDEIITIVRQLRDMHLGDIISEAIPFVEPMSSKVLFNKSQTHGDYQKKNSWVNQLTIVSSEGHFTDIDVFVNRDKYNINGIIKHECAERFFSNIHFEKMKEVEYIGKFNSIEDISWIFQTFRDISFSFHVNYRDVVIGDLVKIRQLCKKTRIVLCFDQMADLKQLNSLVDSCNYLDIEVKGCCFAKNQNDLVFWESIKFDFETIIIPFLDNNDFIINNVCLSENDIMSQKLSEENILTNMTVNSNFFGELILMPDGQFYTDLNSKPLGKLGDDWRIILDKLSNSSWFLTRDKLKPCSDCAFRYLCPPPSNYELVIGKPNLCTIKP